MTRYALARLGLALPAALGATLMVFLLARAVPGDPARAIAGERASPEALARIRARLGLDRPLPVQYLRFLRGLATGDLASAQTGRPVVAEFATHAGATIELSLCALAWSCLAGVALGLAAAVRGGTLDLLSRTVALAGVSMPVFWTGYCLLAAKSTLGLDLLPSYGRSTGDVPSDLSTPFFLIEGALRGHRGWTLDCLRHLILPALTLGTVPLAILCRMQRAALRDAGSADYLRTARAKGLSERAVWTRHALKNAAVPVVTAAGTTAGYLLGGAVLTETVFGLPGLGRRLVEAIAVRDYPVLQGFVLGSALVFISVNVATDLACAALDPRLRDAGADPQRRAPA